MTNPGRSKFGSKAEVLLGERAGDRALRLSDLGGTIAETILKVVKEAGYTTGGGGGGVSDGDKGDITVSGTGTVWTIDPAAVTLSKIANLTTSTILGRNTAGFGPPEELDPSEVRRILELQNYEFIATSASPVALTAANADNLIFTGSTNQVVTLPDVTTLTIGRTFRIINTTTANPITVQSSGGTNLGSTVTNGHTATYTCVALTGTDATPWLVRYDAGRTRTGSGNLVFNSNPTFGGTATFAAATAGAASLQVTHGVDPTTPNNGDMWTTAAAGLKLRVNGETVTLGPNTHGYSKMAPATGLFIPNATNASALGTEAQVADRTIIAPFVPAFDTTIDQIGVSVSTLLAGANAKGVIFASDATGRPTTLLQETANISAAAAATVFSAAFTALTLKAGRTYWIGIRASGAFTLRTLAASALPALDYTNAATPVARMTLIRSEAFATPAAAWTYASAQHSTALMPLVLMRVA